MGLGIVTSPDRDWKLHKDVRTLSYQEDRFNGVKGDSLLYDCGNSIVHNRCCVSHRGNNLTMSRPSISGKARVSCNCGNLKYSKIPRLIDQRSKLNNDEQNSNIK